MASGGWASPRSGTGGAGAPRWHVCQPDLTLAGTLSLLTWGRRQPAGSLDARVTHRAVLARRFSRDIAKLHVPLDLGHGPLRGITEAAAAGGLEADDVALPEAQVDHLRRQRLAIVPADQREAARPRRSAAREAEGPELEALEARREERLRAVDAPLAEEPEPAAPATGAAGIRDQAVAQHRDMPLALDHLDGDVGVVVHAQGIGVGAVLARMRAAAADLDLHQYAPLAG